MLLSSSSLSSSSSSSLSFSSSSSTLRRRFCHRCRRQLHRSRRHRHHHHLCGTCSTDTLPSQTFLSVHPTLSSHLVVGSVPACDAAAGRFRCNNTNCISSSNMCNFVDNCGDNSDEDNCGEPVGLKLFSNNSNNFNAWIILQNKESLYESSKIVLWPFHSAWTYSPASTHFWVFSHFVECDTCRQLSPNLIIMDSPAVYFNHPYRQH